MRLFTGIDLSSEVIANLEMLIERLRPAAQLKWSPVANLHITTRFIGEWHEARLPELTTALQGLTRRAPIPLRVHKLGFYPNPHAPRIFWAGVETPPGLNELARETDVLLESLGSPSEHRPYSPHLTLARIPAEVKKPALQSLREAIAALDSLEFGAFTAGAFYLYQSHPGASHSEYIKLAEYLLQP